MSRAQQSALIDTAKADTAADQTAATTARTAESADIGNYQAQLSKFAASNPYTQGGEYDTSEDKKLSGVADAGSAAIANQENLIAKRTGQNAAAPEAIAAEAARANQRDLSAEEGQTTQTRIADEAGYNQQVQSDTAVPAELEQGIYNTSLGGADATLNTQAGASSTPGFWDTLGDSFASALGKTAGGGNVSASLTHQF